MFHGQTQVNPLYNYNAHENDKKQDPWYRYGKECIIVYNRYKTDKMSLITGEILSGSATSIYNPHRYISMTVSNLNDRAVRQTYDYYYSNSYLMKRCVFTATLNTLKDSTGYRSRIGIFDDHNDKLNITDDVNNKGGSGLFFQLENGIFSVGIRYGVNDNGTDIIIPQNHFNTNKLENNMPYNSRRLYKKEVYEIYYNTVGYIEWSMYINGIRTVLHRYEKFDHDLHVIHRFELPIRYEIEKIQSVVGIGELRQFEECISTERNCEIGNGSGATLPPASVSVSVCKYLSQVSTNLYTIEFFPDIRYTPIFSVRLKPSEIRNPIISYKIDGIAINDCACFQIGIVKNSTFIDIEPVWQNTNYMLQYDINANLIDNNNLTIIKEFFVCPKQPFPSCSLDCRPISISSSIIGEADIFTIVARKMNAHGDNPQAYFSFTWLEET